MFRGKAVLTVILISCGVHWLLHSPFPKGCDYPIALQVIVAITEGMKIAAATNFIFGGKFATPFSVQDMFPPENSSQLTVTYKNFAGVKVAIYRPSLVSETEAKADGSAIIFFHGGGFTIGSINSYVIQTSEIAKKTGSLVIVPEYRLSPEHPFPAAFDDCLAVTKIFLKTAKSYRVNPRKVVLMGDSAGGNLANAVAMAIGQEKSPNPLCMIDLIYPALQVVNFQLPSYRQNPDRPVLDAWFIMRFVLNYIGFGDNTDLAPLLWRNAHMQNFSHQQMLERVDEKLVPERYKLKPDREYFEMVPQEGYQTLRTNLQTIQQVVTDIRLSSLLAEDALLKKLPRTHIVTCEYDPLRDDGIILHQRMQRLGLESSHTNWDFCFHGVFSIYGTNVYKRLDAAVDDMLEVVVTALKAC